MDKETVRIRDYLLIIANKNHDAMNKLSEAELWSLYQSDPRQLGMINYAIVSFTLDKLAICQYLRVQVVLL